MERVEGLRELLREVVERKGGKVIHFHVEDSGEPERGPSVFSLELDARLAKALSDEGVSELYGFQWQAYRLISEGKNVIITAGTGTGKTEAFMIPLLDRLRRLGSSGVQALLIYPTKALARDQARRLSRLIEGSGIRYAILDGDTPPSERRDIYADPPQLLITNPDMIHLGLALSKDFRELVSTTRIAVFDELHVYQGVFGTHLKWVIERLKRAAGDLQLVGAGATIGNPEELGESLFSAEVSVVIGPPRRRSTALHAFVDYGNSSRWTFAAYLTSSLVKMGLKVLTFVDSQQMAELVSVMIRKNHGVEAPVHRAGLPAEYRRRIESMLSSGQVRAVVATSTLELGIDIGDLDAVLMASLPKSYSSYVQRAGRAGRRGRTGLVVTLLGDDPIEAYYARRPEEHFNRRPEQGYIEPDNLDVAKVHLAALLLQSGAARLNDLPKGLRDAADELVKLNVARKTSYLLLPLWSAARRLVESSSLRSSGPIVRIYHGGKRIGEREMPMALYDLHPGALYYHAGRPYIVSSLDLPRMRAEVVALPENVSFYTKPLYDISISEVEPLERRFSGPVPLVYGRVHVIVSVSGYVIKDAASGATISENYYETPITWDYWTMGVLMRYPSLDFGSLEDRLSAYHALEHVLISAARPVIGASDTDLSGVSYPTGHIVIYDSHVGGNGLSRLLFKRLEDVETIAENVVSSCTCYDGCPKCVFSPYCGNNNRFLSRRGALRVLSAKRSASAQAIELESVKSVSIKAA